MDISKWDRGSLRLRDNESRLIKIRKACLPQQRYSNNKKPMKNEPGRVAQSVGHLTRKSGVLGSIPGLATYFRFSFRFFKKGSCQLLANVLQVLVNRLGGLDLPRKSVVRLTDRPDITLDVYRGRQTIIQQQQQLKNDRQKHGKGDI